MQPEQQIPPDVPISIVRPTSVTVVAIITIIGASITLLMIPSNIASLQTSPFFAEPHIHLAFLAAIIYKSLVTPFWLVSGIGLLRLRPWARHTFLLLCVLAILFSITYPVAYWIVIESANQSQPSDKHQIPFMFGMMTIATLLTLAYVITLLILITRPKVTAAFRKSAS